MTPQEKLKLLLAKGKITPQATNSIPSSPESSSSSSSLSIVTRDGKKITYNQKQAEAVSLALSGESFCLTGPAGSGKTTTVEGIINALMDSPRNSILDGVVHKTLPSSGVPGILVCAYTNKATSNVRKKLPLELHRNCMTIHKALEFGPVYFDDVDETGKPKTSMRFEPARNRENPMPSGIYCVIIEESTMLDVPLWNQLLDAFPQSTHPNLQIILIGDIQQLPPVFGKSIFIHAMQKGIPTVELTEVHRQAKENPILNLAHTILDGKPITAPKIPEFCIDKTSEGLGKVTIHPWKKQITDITALKAMAMWLPEQINSGNYSPEVDMILTPFNKGFGTTALNEIIASHLAKILNAEVHEVFTGVKKAYFRIGERVLYQKSEARIIDIQPNRAYYGKMPRLPSNTMDYKGVEHDPSKANLNLTDDQINESLDRIDRFMNSFEDHTSKDSPTARAASHKITVKVEDTGLEYVLSSAGDINNLLLGYVLTVHKSQGSEYNKVFLLLHHSQAIMTYRELLYTAVTRAKEELYIICEPSTFVQGINTQRLPGKNVQEKIAAFEKEAKIQAKHGGNEDQQPRHLPRFIKEKDEQLDIA